MSSRLEVICDVLAQRAACHKCRHGVSESVTTQARARSTRAARCHVISTFPMSSYNTVGPRLLEQEII